MRNLAVKVPEDLWPEFKARVTAAYQGPSRAITRDLASGVVGDYQTALPSATACFMDDFEACIAHLRMPITHRRAIRTTNLLERLFVDQVLLAEDDVEVEIAWKRYPARIQLRPWYDPTSIRVRS